MSDRLRDILGRSLHIAPAQVTDDMEFNVTPGWDSLTHMTLMLTLEDEYGVSISDDDVIELTSVSAIRHYVERLDTPKQDGGARDA